VASNPPFGTFDRERRPTTLDWRVPCVAWWSGVKFVNGNGIGVPYLQVGGQHRPSDRRGLQYCTRQSAAVSSAHTQRMFGRNNHGSRGRRYRLLGAMMHAATAEQTPVDDE
jgi:hypothetical protein